MTPPDARQYADGPLDPATRRALAPDSPTRADWKRVSDGIAARVLPKHRSANWGRRAVAGLAVAGCGLIAVLVWRGNGPAPRATLPDVVKIAPDVTDSLAEFAVLPIATDDELQIATLRGDWGTGLVVGEHPLSGELRLATADEVTVERSPAGTEPTSDHGDLPMVFGLKGKRTGE
jgi:hypothetical protein